jgi:hypothetical protein
MPSTEVRGETYGDCFSWAGTAASVVSELRSWPPPGDKELARLVYDALKELASFECGKNVVVTWMYPETRRQHMRVAPCKIIVEATLVAPGK